MDSRFHTPKRFACTILCFLGVVGIIVLSSHHFSSDVVNVDTTPTEQPNNLVPLPETFTVQKTDYLHLGYQKVVYSKTSGHTGEKTVLVTSSMTSGDCFGRGRTFGDFYHVVESLEYPKSSIHLSLYCGSAELFDSVQEFFGGSFANNECPYNKVTLLYAPFLQNDFKPSEKEPKLQRTRRRAIARGRNFLVLNSLDAEEYTLFLDADITSFNHRDMLERFVKCGRDIIVPRIEYGPNIDYDLNSWRGQRNVPSNAQLKLMDENKWDETDFFSADMDGVTYHLGTHVKETRDLPETDERRDLNYSFELDSVGGGVLFAKSIIYKQGVVFPTLNVIGTAWSRSEGYDGIETEGLCYMARNLGYRCYGMPNLVAQHFVS